jgi:hypothetical protein
MRPDFHEVIVANARKECAGQNALLDGKALLPYNDSYRQESQ